MPTVGIFWVSVGNGAMFSPNEGDVGRMDMSSVARDVTDKSIFLTHWGLFQDYPFSGWEKSHR